MTFFVAFDYLLPVELLEHIGVIHMRSRMQYGQALWVPHWSCLLTVSPTEATNLSLLVFLVTMNVCFDNPSQQD
jgi:hypothetical protein